MFAGSNPVFCAFCHSARPKQAAPGKGLQVCAACRSVSYCSRECQKSDWKQHKAACKYHQQAQLTSSLMQDLAVGETGDTYDGDQAKTDSSVAESVDGVQIVPSGTALGRVVVARRAFAPGDVVLAEAATLVFATAARGRLPALLSAFKSATSQRQQAVLGMFHPPLDSPEACAALRTSGNVLELAAASELGIDIEVAQRVVLISHYNAHSFFGHNNIPAGDVLVPGGVVPDAPYTALFEIGSKVEHSFFPNVTYSSKSGQLVYTATLDIAAGERVTFSYIHYIDIPEQARRNALLTSKSFRCECARCEGPDMCRPLPCPVCKDGVVLRTSPCDGQEPASWTCLACQAQSSDENMHDARNIELGLLADLKKVEKVQQMVPGIVRRTQDLQSRVRSALPPSHYLHARFSELISRFAASEAAMLYGTQQNDLRCEAAACLMVRAHASAPCRPCTTDATWRMPGNDKQSANLTRSSRGGLSPDKRLSNIVDNVWLASTDEAAILMPVWEKAKEAFYAGKDLMDVGRPKQKKQAAAIFRRYHAALMQWLAPDDPDRQYNQQAVHRAGDPFLGGGCGLALTAGSTSI
eukprot:gene8-12816_t